MDSVNSTDTLLFFTTLIFIIQNDQQFLKSCPISMVLFQFYRCSLSARSTCRNPRPTRTHTHHTAIHSFYPILYAIAFSCNVYNCHHRHVFLFLLLLTLVTVTLWAHCIPTKLFCMYHVYTIWCLYVLCTFTPCMLCTFTTTVYCVLYTLFWCYINKI